MKSWIHGFSVLGILATMTLVVGCKTTSHHSVRVYEYSDEPPARPTDEKGQSEYEMVSPGQMVNDDE